MWLTTNHCGANIPFKRRYPMKCSLIVMASIITTLIISVAWIVAHNPRLIGSSRRPAAFAIVDTEGHHVPALMAIGTASPAHVAFFDRYSRRFGRVSPNVESCAPRATHSVRALWDLITRQAKSLVNTPAYASAPCPAGGWSYNDCPDPDCFSSICFGLGNGCYDTHNSCLCPDTKTC
jgi:hypothetical protein